MTMQLTCPECGKEFEIEESQQAHGKQAAALKAQQEEAKIETQRLLEEQKEQLAKDQEVKGSSNYEYEPDEKELLELLLPRNVTTQIYSALLESSAAELAARMTAMDNATRNAGDMIDRLTLVYNRTRQANITKELIEIISGAEAL